eukprot:CAMPEP_0204912792 /NCGR_PEP_ID=MMETSP1397-20131031/10889_1 /ASSEMBLY_ACC=CAM_ASM_000891 /TAXON_ID=49980 /ORGANISM="Climacostomum Climacostomum virens, Strain Stock W-24" /LENGTH=989 /DNA_ID=CAMNT_0052083893 /DNA_START=201 /DNA_END=3166 /DNA_ORIENTATION=+
MKYTSEIQFKAKKGTLTDLPLAQLQNIPLLCIEAPLSIANVLFEVLDEDAVWGKDFLFQIRSNIARLSRRFFFSYFRQETLTGTYPGNQLHLTRELLRHLEQKRYFNSGVEAELNSLSNMLQVLKLNHGWLAEVVRKSPILLESYAEMHPASMLGRVSELLHSEHASNDAERQVICSLIVDCLYSQPLESAVALFKEMMKEVLPWESKFMALAYIEWAVYRSWFSQSSIETKLKPSLEALVEQNHMKVNEKLETLLRKLKAMGSMQGLEVKSVRPDVKIMLSELPIELLNPEHTVDSLTNIPKTPADFTGRESELRRLKKKLLADKFVVVTGLSGVGKSVLAFRAAKDLLPQFDVVWYFNAKNTSSFEAGAQALASNFRLEILTKEVRAQALASNFRSGASTGAGSRKPSIKHKGPIIREVEKFTGLRKALSRVKGKVLLVFDDIGKEVIAPLELFKVLSNAYILVTSELKTKEETINITNWSEEEAVTFMTKDEILSSEDKAVRQLVLELDCYPLACTLAKSYIVSEEMTAADYLTRMRKDRQAYDIESSLVNQVLQKNIERAQNANSDTKLVLTVLALLSSDFIPYPLISVLLADIDPNCVATKGLKCALSYSLINATPDNKAIAMRKVVQKAVLRLSSDDLPSIIGKLIRSIESHMDAKDVDVISLTQASRSTQLLTSNILTGYEEFCLKFLITDVELGLDRDKCEAMQEFYKFLTPVRTEMIDRTLLSKFGMLLADAGFHDESMNIARRALGRFELLEDNIKVIVSNQVGNTFFANNEVRLAEDCFKKAFAICNDNELRGKERADALEGMGKVAYHLANYDHAQEYFESSLSLRKALFGRTSIEVSYPYHWLALIYEVKGDNEKALKFYLKSIAIQEKFLSSQHKVLGEAYDDLGTLYTIIAKAQSDPEGRRSYLTKGTQYIRKAIAIYEATQSDNFDWSEAHYTLGCALNELQDLEGAADHLGRYAKACEANDSFEAHAETYKT